MTPRFRVSAVAIDLDGTLLDTIAEIADATNDMLVALGRMPLPVEQVRSFVGKGIGNLIRRALSATGSDAPDTPELERATESFRACYQRVLGRDCRPYDGVVEGLERLRGLGLRLACITNKAERFTLPLLEATQLAPYFELVVSGDSLPHAKPHPAPLLHVAARFGIAPDRLLMIGDSGNDAQAARAAGCPVLIVPYGYNEGAPVDDLDCDGIVTSLAAAALCVQPGAGHPSPNQDLTAST